MSDITLRDTPQEELRDTPYKGLVPYEEADHEFFNGRDEESEVITANLMASRLTLLYGPSGVGKSSVLHAGVAAELRKESNQNGADTGLPRFVIVIFNDWKDDPLADLLNQIERTVTVWFPDKTFAPPSPKLSFADKLSVWTEQLGGKLLIVLDQFEDYFLYPQTDTFALEFPRAVNRPDLRANFLISIREDWLAKLDRFKIDLPNLFDNYLRIDALKRADASLAIEQPVAKYNELRTPDEPAVVVLKGFANKVLDQLEALANENILGESGSGQVKGKGESEALKTTIQPPYLQLVMIHLWKQAIDSTSHQLDPEMLNDSDTAKKIIQSHIEEVMNELSDNEREAASLVFHHLVTPSGRKIAQSLGDLADYAELPKSQIRPMLDTLSSKKSAVLSRLVPPPDASTEPRYEIYHDLLGPAVLLWRTRYVNEKELREANLRAEQEQQKAKEQARIAARLRRLSAALAVITTLAILLGLGGLYLVYVTRTQKILIAAAQEKVNESTRQSTQLKFDADKAIEQSKIDRTNADEAIEQSKIDRTNADKAIEQSKIDKTNADKAIQQSLRDKTAADIAIANSVAAQTNAEQAEKRANLYGRVTDLYQQALALDRDGKVNEAKATYVEIYELVKQTDNLTTPANALSQAAAVAARFAYDPQTATEAVKLYTDALELYRKVPNKKEEAATLLALGPLYSIQRDLKRSVDAYVDAALLYQQMNDIDGLDKVVGGVGPIQNSLYQIGNEKELGGEGLPEKEIAMHERLLLIYHGNKKYRQNEVSTLSTIGYLHFKLAQKEKAIEYYKKALQLAPNDALTLKIIGDIYYQLNKKYETISYYEQALPSVETSGGYYAGADKPTILASLGDIYWQLRMKHKALQYYALLQEIPYWQGLALKKTGDMFLELNEKQAALDYYLKLISLVDTDSNALAITSVINEFGGPLLRVQQVQGPSSVEVQLEVLKNIAAIYKDAGNEAEFLRFSQRAEKLAEDLKPKP